MSRTLGALAFLALAIAAPVQQAAAQDPNPLGGALLGGAAGAIIGGVAGGGKGAAIGAGIGAGAGAGSNVIRGSNQIKLESGTEMLIRTTR